jgi:hypothetical protein
LERFGIWHFGLLHEQPPVTKTGKFCQELSAPHLPDFCLQSARRYGNVACGMTKIIRIAIIGITGISPGG